MEKKNILHFKVFGRRALFSEPETRVGGEKFTYQIPTYEAIKGIAESIYWKPTFKWKVNKIRVVKPIQTETVGVKPIIFSGGNNLAYYTYLKDVEYEVEIQMEWSLRRIDLIKDRNENKHYFMAKRAIAAGGRRDIFLGSRECQAYVEPCELGSSKSFYDKPDGSDTEITFGLQFHSFTYPSDSEDESNKLVANFWRPKMVNGVIDFESSKNFEFSRVIKNYEFKEFILNENILPVEEEVKRFELDEHSI